MKDNKKFTKKAQILSLNECLYLELEGSFASEEELFSKACEKLDIEKRFEYAFSFMKSETKTHIFLSEFAKLDTSQKISLCELVLWRNLSKIKINLSSYCVFIMNERSSFLAFFDKENLLFAKSISRHLKPLNDDYSALLELLNFSELIKKYQSQNFFISQNLSTEFKKIDLDYELISTLGENLNDKLLSFELQRKEKSVNFLRHLKSLHLSFQSLLIWGFVASFLLAFFIETSFIYKDIKTQVRLENEDKQRLSLNLTQEKNLLNEEKISSQNALITQLQAFHKENHLVSNLGQIFEIFYQNKVQITSLNYQNELFKIHTQTLNDGLLNALYSNEFFLLKEKKQDKGEFMLYLKARQ